MKSRKRLGSENVMKIDGFADGNAISDLNSEFRKKQAGEPMKSRKRLGSENVMKIDGFADGNAISDPNSEFRRKQAESYQAQPCASTPPHKLTTTVPNEQISLKNPGGLPGGYRENRREPAGGPYDDDRLLFHQVRTPIAS